MDPITVDDIGLREPAFRPEILPGVTYTPNVGNFSPSPALLMLTDPRENPNNSIINAAWQAAMVTYNTLPPEAFDLPALRSIYSGQVAVLSRAARWADDRLPRETCFVDPDSDQDPECILASENVYTMTDIDGGRLLSMFVATDSGIHQVVAPTSQFIVGLSDSTNWRFEYGEGADPGGVHGAFADTKPPWNYYLPSENTNSIGLTTGNQGLSKTFSLIEQGIRVEYLNDDPISIEIPIVLDPWLRFTSSWGDKYQGEFIPDGYRWKVEGGPSVEIRSYARLRVYPFSDSRSKLSAPEDPNFTYPVGHYLPFPLILVEAKSPGGFYVEITLTG
jgi:hypothetical protein